MESREEITLDVEGTLIACKKDDLIANSDYFKVMLQGNFVEKDIPVIKLQDVDLKSFDVILKILWDESYIIDDEDLLTVLQTSCMLQFNHIKERCVEKITELLSPINCLTVWHISEQLDIRPLNLKAKAMSLVEFLIVKDLDCVLQLNINQLYKYLSNTKLRVADESDVFETCMKWYYENSTKENLRKNLDDTGIFKLFLRCVDFKLISDGTIKEMLVYPDLSKDGEIKRILNDILKLKKGAGIIDVCDEAVRLYNCKRRVNFCSPCFFIDSFAKCFKRQKISSTWFYDKFKRKRQSLILENASSSESNEYKVTSKSILLYDAKLGNFRKLIDVPSGKYLNLEGFRVVGYKDCVFLFGGEVCLGRGNWNNNFWVYDTVRDRWERITKLPYERRHFECCLSGDILYVVGGTGNFRVIQDNMFYYKYKTNEWSKIHSLPCPGRQVKCCDFQGQLFLLNINGRCGYVFNITSLRWTELPIICDNNFTEIKEFPKKFALFSYEDKLYLKSSGLIEIQLMDNKLKVTDHKRFVEKNYEHIESVVCNTLVYTLYVWCEDDKKHISLEKIDLNAPESEWILDRKPEKSILDISGDLCELNGGLKLFSFQHYSSVEEDIYLHDRDL